MKLNASSSTERRLRRQVEILWAIIGFLLVFSFSQVPVWVFAKNMDSEKSKAVDQVKDTSTAQPPAKTMHFAVKANGQVWADGKLVSEAEIRSLFAQEKNVAVELAMGNRNVVAIFYECVRHNLAPTVKLAAN